MSTTSKASKASSKSSAPSTASRTCAAFERLSAILDTLRSQCPWDRVQTLKSLRYLTVEEVHELGEAIIALDTEGPTADPAHRAALVANLKKELGDLAMHVMFYTKIAEDEGLFAADEVYDAICDKLISRHPFIYHQADYHGESWEQLKMREADRRGVLDGVPDSLPPLVKAVRMQEKVAGMGAEVVADRNPLVESLPPDTTEAQLGDLLFALVDWARRHGINADDALAAANRRFRRTIA